MTRRLNQCCGGQRLHVVFIVAIIGVLLSSCAVENNTTPQSLAAIPSAAIVDSLPTLTQEVETLEPTITTPPTPTPEPTATASPVPTATSTATPAPQVGETRLNPNTGVEEVYNESGQWVEVAEEGELHIQGGGENASFVEMMDGTWQEANPTLMHVAPEAKRTETVDGNRWAYDEAGLRVAGFDEETSSWFAMLDESYKKRSDENKAAFLAGQLEYKPEHFLESSAYPDVEMGPDYHELRTTEWDSPWQYEGESGESDHEYTVDTLKGVGVLLGYYTDDEGLMVWDIGVVDETGKSASIEGSPGYLDHGGLKERLSETDYITSKGVEPFAYNYNRSGAGVPIKESLEDLDKAIGRLIFFKGSRINIERPETMISAGDGYWTGPSLKRYNRYLTSNAVGEVFGVYEGNSGTSPDTLWIVDATLSVPD